MEQVGLSRGAGHDMFVKWPVHRMFLKPDAFALRLTAAYRVIREVRLRFDSREGLFSRNWWSGLTPHKFSLLTQFPDVSLMCFLVDILT